MPPLFLVLVPSDSATALAIAKSCSPRVARYGDVIVADVSGSARTIGSPAAIAREVVALAEAHDVRVRVGVAPTVVAAWIVAHVHAGATIVDPGAAARVLAPLPLRALQTTIALDPERARVGSLVTTYAERLAVFEQWGLKTIGAVAALPRRDVHARMGPVGVRLHQAACGEDAFRFVPLEAIPPFAVRMALDWPIEGLEPLAFVVGRLADDLAGQLVRADRGAVVLRTRLKLVTRDTHERVLCLPAPIADARVLRTLVMLDLESHPPGAGIDAVDLQVDVLPGRIVQGALFAPTVPTAETLTTLLARLIALMGESRVGAPRVLDTFDPRRVGMESFTVGPEVLRGSADGRSRKADALSSSPKPQASSLSAACIRRFRRPVIARVMEERGVPVRVQTHVKTMAGGGVVRRAGPWRTSGEWWTDDGGWDRDEWDVALTDGALYRLARDRRTGQWVIEGILD